MMSCGGHFHGIMGIHGCIMFSSTDDMWCTVELLAESRPPSGPRKLKSCTLSLEVHGTSSDCSFTVIVIVTIANLSDQDITSQ
jgi:hypothetical protein